MGSLFHLERIPGTDQSHPILPKVYNITWRGYYFSSFWNGRSFWQLCSLCSIVKMTMLWVKSISGGLMKNSLISGYPDYLSRSRAQLYVNFWMVSFQRLVRGTPWCYLFQSILVQFIGALALSWSLWNNITYNYCRNAYTGNKSLL